MMSPTQKLVHHFIRIALRVLCRIDDEQLKKVPERGPLLAIGNHINFMEAPVLVTHLYPRPINILAKDETWEHPIKRYLFDMWGGIPIARGEADRAAMRSALDSLAAGRILGVAPEGTRSHDGCLQKGYPGVVLLALRAEVPVLPVAFYGSEYFWKNIRRLRRTDFHIVVGNPFRVVDRGDGFSREVREQMTQEMMYQLAALLPPQNRGVYSDLEKATSRYLVFEPGVMNNLLNRWEDKSFENPALRIENAAT